MKKVFALTAWFSILLTENVFAQEREYVPYSLGDIVPGTDVSFEEFISFGETAMLGAKDQKNIAECVWEEMMFCVKKEGKFTCARWSDGIVFKFFPIDGKSDLPIEAMGHSNDEENYPEKIYHIIPCGR